VFLIMRAGTIAPSTFPAASAATPSAAEIGVARARGIGNEGGDPAILALPIRMPRIQPGWTSGPDSESATYSVLRPPKNGAEEDWVVSSGPFAIAFVSWPRARRAAPA